MTNKGEMTMRSSTSQDNPIARDIQNVVSDAQDLLKTVQTEGTDRANDKMGEMRAKLQAQIDTARQTLGELQQTVQATASQYMDTTDAYVRANPWQAVGMSAAVGALVGFLIARR
jgi:ElaB protein